MKKDVNIDGEFSYTVQNPTLYRARHIGLQLIDEYVREELDEVYIIYTKMINAFKMEADMFQILPLHREEYLHKNLQGYNDQMMFHPSVETPVTFPPLAPTMPATWVPWELPPETLVSLS